MYIFKTFLSAFTPLAVGILVVGVWLIIKLIMKEKVNLSRSIILSLITVVYFFHTTITSIMFGLFKCFPIEGESLLERDMTVKCWNPVHMVWVIFLGIPYIVVWTFGLPILGIVFFTIRRKHLKKASFRAKYLIMYQGLKDNRYYWEFINIIRKVSLASVNVFIPH